MRARVSRRAAHRRAQDDACGEWSACVPGRRSPVLRHTAEPARARVPARTDTRSSALRARAPSRRPESYEPLYLVVRKRFGQAYVSALGVGHGRQDFRRIAAQGALDMDQREAAYGLLIGHGDQTVDI